jgi:hypothetical protein
MSESVFVFIVALVTMLVIAGAATFAYVRAHPDRLLERLYGAFLIFFVGLGEIAAGHAIFD